MIYMTEILIFLATVIATLYIWMLYRHSYWKRKHIPYIPTKPIFGNIADIMLFRNNSAEVLKEMYDHKVAQNEPVVGIHLFHKPALLVREPELIKQILIRDFNKFSHRHSKADPVHDKIAGNNIFFMKNPEWKKLRNKISPIFASGKMKQMFIYFNEISERLDSFLSSQPVDSKTNSFKLEMKETFALFTTDLIVNLAFGLDPDCLKNKDSDFRKNGREIFNFNFLRAIEFSFFFFLPELVPICRFKIFTKKAEHFLKSTIDYVMNDREKKDIKKGDVIDALMNLRDASKTTKDENDINFDNDVLLAQAALFFTGGFETSSSTMSFAVYELSKAPHYQQKLRDEIKEVLEKCDGKLTYETVQNMSYLNCVIQETLRLYPLMPYIDRECYLYENEEGYSLEPFSPFVIPNGMPLFIPIYAIHRDPNYFSDPDTFIPDRFAPENKDNIIPFTYMPFGVGPRNCIGERFGLLQVRVGLINFFKNHYVKELKNAPSKIKFNSRSVLIQAVGGINCEVVRDPLLK